MNFNSHLTPLMEQFGRYRTACGHWSSFEIRMLSDFDRFLAKDYPAAEQLTQEMVDAWCAVRPTEKPGSCVTRTNIVRGFVRWLRERNLTEVSIPDSPKVPPQTIDPYYFTADELRSFFNACDTYPYKGSKRRVELKRIEIPVIFRLLYSTGMRPPEVRLLQRADIDLTQGVISIKSSKGPDQHYVVLHDSMNALMQRYDNAMENLMPSRVFFFPDPNDQPYKPMWLWAQFQQLAESCDIVGATPYDFRHNYAITNINNWIGLGLSFDDRLIYLSKSMGHRKLSSTLYYYSLVPALADILITQADQDSIDIIPEVVYEE